MMVYILDTNIFRNSLIIFRKKESILNKCGKHLKTEFKKEYINQLMNAITS